MECAVLTNVSSFNSGSDVFASGRCSQVRSRQALRSCLLGVVGSVAGVLSIMSGGLGLRVLRVGVRFSLVLVAGRSILELWYSSLRLCTLLEGRLVREYSTLI